MAILGKITTFLGEVKTEMKKVNWLSKNESLKYTAIVIGIFMTVAVLLGFLDFLFTFLLNKFVL